jgi:GTPase SAR1 family protein
MDEQLVDTVKICILGDEGVGKTRFIRTCLAEVSEPLLLKLARWTGGAGA